MLALDSQQFVIGASLWIEGVSDVDLATQLGTLLRVEVMLLFAALILLQDVAQVLGSGFQLLPGLLQVINAA